MTALFFGFNAPTYFTIWVKREGCNMKRESIVVELDFVIGRSGKEDSVLKNIAFQIFTLLYDILIFYQYQANVRHYNLAFTL